MFDLIALRRDLHAHPELAFAEVRTTTVIVEQLESVGLKPEVLPSGTGVVCDIGTDGPLVALRADIDALPLPDEKDVPYRSTIDGACHGCGHDAHTAILLGAAARLAADPPPGRVRLIFQPAEETVPGGAPSVVAAGGLDGVEQIYALHCDPRLETGQVGVRVGNVPNYLLPPPFDVLAINLSLIGHFRPMVTGSVFVSDICYFVTLALLALFLATRRLAER
ncbi:MAG: amidohydrolase [Actinobacteria bacterium]|nr:amidohydrolase [Actinomycetota bacterium]